MSDVSFVAWPPRKADGTFTSNQRSPCPCGSQHCTELPGRDTKPAPCTLLTTHSEALSWVQAGEQEGSDISEHDALRAEAKTVPLPSGHPHQASSGVLTSLQPTDSAALRAPVPQGLSVFLKFAKPFAASPPPHLVSRPPGTLLPDPGAG